MLHGITDSDLVGKGIKDLPDIPGLSADEMKRKFEEIVRDVVITKFNEAVEEINSQFFVTPEGIAYLTQQNIIASYATAITTTDTSKIVAAVAIGEMDTALKNSIKTVSDNVALLAKKYVLLNPNGGTGTVSQLEYSNGMTITGTFTREGYTFKGWSTIQNGAKAYNAGGTISTFTANHGGNIMELFALWEANE